MLALRYATVIESILSQQYTAHILYYHIAVDCQQGIKQRIYLTY